MSELSSDARALIDAEAASDAPTAADRTRIKARLASELGAGVFVGAALVGAAQATPHVAKSGAALWLQGAAKLVALAGAAGTLYAGLTWIRPAHERPAEPSRVSTPAREHASEAAPTPERDEVPTAPSLTTPDVQSLAPPTAPATKATRAKPARTREPAQQAEPPAAASTATGQPTPAPASIAAELALLARAQRALRDGDAPRALAITQEHARSFAAGALQEERAGIETLARCILGEPDAAAGARRFLTRAPSSPLASRVRQECKLR